MHHYLDKPTRVQATINCFNMLKQNGIFVTFENIMPFSDSGRIIGLTTWSGYQTSKGTAIVDVNRHIQRYGKEYFPISIIDHINLLKDSGFREVEVLWASFMQAGFYAIK